VGVLKSVVLNLIGADRPAGLLSGADDGLAFSERDGRRSPFESPAHERPHRDDDQAAKR
jgi:hypothetical protein